MNLYYRILNAVKIAWWAFMNPAAIQHNNLKMITGLYGLIFKVATEKSHMMTKIAYIHPIEGEKEIVSIWAGSGIGSDPTKRISELLSENSRLKMELSQKIYNQ